MKSNDTKRIIKEIALEEGISEWDIMLIVKSQFEGVHEIISKAIPDNPETFYGVRLNAFGHFKVMKAAFRKFKGHEVYLADKRRRYDAKK